MTEYRFSLRARLVTLGVLSLVALMALLFALGVVVGQRVAAPAAETVHEAAAVEPAAAEPPAVTP
jgi:hypothetical protein